jgi:uncharacterized membrane protein required for colicin V production
MLVDLGLALVAVYAFYLGYSRGIIRTLFSIISLILGIAVAMKLSPFVISFFETVFNTQNSFTYIGGFVATFIIVIILLRLLGRGLEKVLRKFQINFINKILGGALLTFVFIVGYSYILWFLDESRLLNQNVKNSSASYAYLRDVPAASKETVAKLKPIFQDFWNKTMDTLDRVREGAPENESSI